MNSKVQTIRHEIGDGINFCSARTDRFKHSALTVSYTSKLTAENAALNSLLAAVLTRGCKSFPTMKELNRELDRLYSASIDYSVSKYGEVHTVNFNVSALENRFVTEDEDITLAVVRLTLEMLLDPVLCDGVFPTEVVETEKKNLIDSINASKNNKDAYALRRCAEIMCEGERYSTFKYGTVEAVEQISPESLTEWYHQVISSAKFDIYFVGDYDQELLAEELRDIFSSVKRCVSVEQPTTKVRKKAGELKSVTETEPVNQAKLVLGFRLGRSLADRNFAAMTLYRELLGGSPTSKLFLNVREKLSLCYYCSASLEPIKGLMFVAAGIDGSNAEKAKTAILEQTAAIANGEISDEELKLAKDSLINKYKEIEDSPSAIIDWYLRRGIIGIVDSPDLASLAISFLTKEQVVKAANEIYLDTVYLLDGEKKED